MDKMLVRFDPSSSGTIYKMPAIYHHKCKTVVCVNNTYSSLQPVDLFGRPFKAAFSFLVSQSDIVIKPAAKCSAVVVMSYEDYMAEANQQLSDDPYYHLLGMDPTETRQ